MRKFRQGRLGVEAFRFLVVGAANFLLTLVVFTTLLKVLHLHHLVALGVAWLVGVIFSFALNFAWVFQPTGDVDKRGRFSRFLFANVVSVVLNMAALDALVRTTGFDPFWLQMGLIPLIVLFNFSTAKFWSLRREQNA